MTRPDTQTLYIMQNEFGLIKIGRSLNPEDRRKSLQSGENCALAIVAALEKQGHREEEVHLGLKRHKIEGEWFKGTPSARNAITRALPDLSGCDWPFDYDARGAEAWLDAFFNRRDRRSIEKKYARLLNGLRRIDGPGPGADALVCHLLALSETGRVAKVAMDRENGEIVGRILHPGASCFLPVLPYSTGIAAALTLWPDDSRPDVWEGTAYDCALAAMQERYARLRRAGPHGR